MYYLVDIYTTNIVYLLCWVLETICVLFFKYQFILHHIRPHSALKIEKYCKSMSRNIFFASLVPLGLLHLKNSYNFPKLFLYLFWSTVALGQSICFISPFWLTICIYLLLNMYLLCLHFKIHVFYITIYLLTYMTYGLKLQYGIMAENIYLKSIQNQKNHGTKKSKKSLYVLFCIYRTITLNI